VIIGSLVAMIATMTVLLVVDGTGMF
jgi:hypothetical protein